MLDTGPWAWHLATMRAETGNAGRRLVWAVVLAVALVVGAVALPSYAGTREGTLRARMDAQKKQELEARPHVDPPGTPPHNHNDPKTKNSVSRAGETGEDVRDPSTSATRAAARAAVAATRMMKDPRLTKVRAMQRRLKHPQDRYAMANGCYRLRGMKIYFKPTDLGQYLLFTPDQRFLVNGGTVAAPSDATIWTARARKHGYSFSNAGQQLVAKGKHTFRLKRAKGCTAYPEAGIDISGKPHGGATPYQEVRGLSLIHI